MKRSTFSFPRLDALGMIMEAAAGTAADLRSKAIRLAANRLFTEPSLQAHIEVFAVAELAKLLELDPLKPPEPAKLPSAKGEPGERSTCCLFWVLGPCAVYFDL